VAYSVRPGWPRSTGPRPAGVRAGPGLRAHNAHRRPLVRGIAAGIAPARGAARHGWPDRVVDKRHVRRDRADYFSTKSRASAARSPWPGGWSTSRAPGPVERGRPRAGGGTGRALGRPADATGIEADPLAKTRNGTRRSPTPRDARLDPRGAGLAEIFFHGGPGRSGAAASLDALHRAGRRVLDPRASPGTGRPDPDLRTNELELGTGCCAPTATRERAGV